MIQAMRSASGREEKEVVRTVEPPSLVFSSVPPNGTPTKPTFLSSVKRTTSPSNAPSAGSLAAQMEKDQEAEGSLATASYAFRASNQAQDGKLQRYEFTTAVAMVAMTEKASAVFDELTVEELDVRAAGSAPPFARHFTLPLLYV